MKKILTFVLIALCVAVMMTSCASRKLEVGEVGKLPRHWWTMSRGELQNKLRKNGTESYGAIISFIGQSDNIGCASTTDAIAMAKLDADTQLSQYIIQKTYDIMTNEMKTVVSQMNDGEKEAVSRTIESVSNNLRNSLSMAEFSSFIVEGTHTEAATKNGISYYKGWVACTVLEDVIQQTRALQQAAFESILAAATEYRDAIVEIEAKSMNALSEHFLDDIANN